MKHTIGTCVAAGLALLALQTQAAQLDSSRWTVTELGTGKNVTRAVTDNNIDTCWADTGAKGLLIDLGHEAVLHRIYFTPGGGVTNGYKQAKLSFLHAPEDPQGVTRVYHGIACEWWKVAEQRRKLQMKGEDFLPDNKVDVDLKFDPIRARYLRIEGASPIAEIEIYGSLDRAAREKRDAVVVWTNAPDVLRVAAEDLRYYIGELTGRPLPIIAPEQEAEYPGTLYRLVDLAPLARTYDDMVANTAAGKLPNGAAKPGFVTYPTGKEDGFRGLKLPDGVNVEREGRAVLFKAWPYRNVAFSVWEFLRREGVNWVAPDDHGDLVPTGKGVELSILPLRYQPSSDMRVGDCDMQAFQHGATFYPNDYLYLLRSGYSTPYERFLDRAKEVPAIPQGQIRDQHAKDLKPEYKEGFFSSPHNLHAAIPRRLLDEHPDWCGMGPDGQRKSPSKGGPQTFCFTSPEVIQFVADKMVYWSGDNPDCAAHFRLVPSDSATFCQCPRCLALCKLGERPAMAFCAGPQVMSGPYYYFITEVAKRVKAQRPHLVVEALAYADYTPAPRQIAAFPDNTAVQVCVYGAGNLPLSSAPANAQARAYLEEWPKRGVPLMHWDYELLNENARMWPMPVPLVTALADRARYLTKLGMWNGLCQADSGSFVYNPWNRYAHPRLLWNANLTADQLLQEFFTGYYQEAAKPMLAYYKAAEDYQIRNDISLYGGGYTYSLTPGAYPFHVLQEMEGHLKQAEAAATGWVVRGRVAAMRKGFDWLLVNTGIGAKRIDTFASFPVMGPGQPPLTVAIKDADVVPLGYKRAGDFAIGNRDRVGHLVRFEADGNYIVSISGCGYTEPRHRKDRTLAAYVNGGFSERQPIPDGKGTYSFTVRATKGVWEAGIQSVVFGAGPFFLKEFTIKPKE